MKPHASMSLVVVLAVLCAACGSAAPTVTVTPSADSVAQKEHIQISIDTQPAATGDATLQATAGAFESSSGNNATVALAGGKATIGWSCDANKDSHCAGHVGFTATVNGGSGSALVNVALPATADGGQSDAGM